MPGKAAVALALAIAGGIAGVASAQTQTSRFDGRWDVTLVCGPTSDGGQPYSFRFPADVKAGLLHGVHGLEGQPAYLVIDGRIGADGESTMLADGLTGDPNRTLGRLAPGQPYTYRIKAHFDEAHGSGTRTSGGGRSCTLDFVRR